MLLDLIHSGNLWYARQTPMFFYSQFSSIKTFATTQRSVQEEKILREIDIDVTYEVLGEQRCKALLGFHSFTGRDQTAKFYGKWKLDCWKTFFHSPPEVLEAFS